MPEVDAQFFAADADRCFSGACGRAIYLGRVLHLQAGTVFSVVLGRPVIAGHQARHFDVGLRQVRTRHIDHQAAHEYGREPGHGVGATTARPGIRAAPGIGVPAERQLAERIGFQRCLRTWHHPARVERWYSVARLAVAAHAHARAAGHIGENQRHAGYAFLRRPGGGNGLLQAGGAQHGAFAIELKVGRAQRAGLARCSQHCAVGGVVVDDAEIGHSVVLNNQPCQ